MVVARSPFTRLSVPANWGTGMPPTLDSAKYTVHFLAFSRLNLTLSVLIVIWSDRQTIIFSRAPNLFDGGENIRVWPNVTITIELSFCCI